MTLEMVEPSPTSEFSLILAVGKNNSFEKKNNSFEHLYK